MKVLLLLFQSGFLFIYFSALIVVANVSKTMLNGSDESGHPCLVPDFRGNTFSISPLRIMFAVGLPHILFIMLKYVPSIPPFWRLFIINGYWILSKVSSTSIEIITWLLSFSLLICYIALIDLWTLKNPCIAWIKSTCSWCIIFWICCSILFTRLLLRIFASKFISDIGL